VEHNEHPKDWIDQLIHAPSDDQLLIPIDQIDQRKLTNVIQSPFTLRVLEQIYKLPNPALLHLIMEPVESALAGFFQGAALELIYEE
jgi:hypothetical protein